MEFLNLEWKIPMSDTPTSQLERIIRFVEFYRVKTNADFILGKLNPILSELKLKRNPHLNVFIPDGLSTRELIFVKLFTKIITKIIETGMMIFLKVREYKPLFPPTWELPIIDIFTEPKNYESNYYLRLNMDKEDPLYQELVDYRKARMNYVVLDHACRVGCLDPQRLSYPNENIREIDVENENEDVKTLLNNADADSGDFMAMITKAEAESRDWNYDLADFFDNNIDPSKVIGDWVESYNKSTVVQPLLDESSSRIIIAPVQVQVQSQSQSPSPSPVGNLEEELMRRLSQFDNSVSMKQYIQQCVAIITGNAKIMDSLYREDIVARYYHDRLSEFILSSETMAAETKKPEGNNAEKLTTWIANTKLWNLWDKSKEILPRPPEPRPLPEPDSIIKDKDDFVRYTTTDLSPEQKEYPRGKRAEKLFTNTLIQLHKKLKDHSSVNMNMAIAVCVTTTKKYTRKEANLSVALRMGLGLGETEKSATRFHYKTKMKFPLPVPSQKKKEIVIINNKKIETDENITYEWIPIELVGEPGYIGNMLESLKLHDQAKINELFTEYMSLVTDELYKGKAGYDSVQYEVRLIFKPDNDNIPKTNQFGTDIHCVDFLRDYETEYSRIHVNDKMYFFRSCMDWRHKSDNTKAAWVMIRGMNKTPILLCSSGRMDELPSNCDPLVIDKQGNNARKVIKKELGFDVGVEVDVTEDDDATEVDDDATEADITPVVKIEDDSFPRHQIGAGISAKRNDKKLIRTDDYKAEDDSRFSGIPSKYQWVNLLEFVYLEIHKKIIPTSLISTIANLVKSKTSIWKCKDHG
jgi:hypothetical protein